jgi:S-adenosylmethionine hydrolase
MRPVIALLSDFGLRDHYAGTMKGVILGICPEAALVDITHDIPPHDVLAGALELASCWRHFPPGTVFLAVVDPGVGSSRRPIAAAAGACHFVAPDNGLLAPVLDAAPPSAVVHLANPKFGAPAISRTFEGRDRFAPAAAWLARGVRLEDLGPRLDGYERLALPEAGVNDDGVSGEVIRVDRFGNLVTNISERLLAGALGREWLAARIRVAGRDVGPLVATYSEVGEGDACALVGSTGHLEISVNRGSAADQMGVGRGAAVSADRPGKTEDRAPRTENGRQTR